MTKANLENKAAADIVNRGMATRADALSMLGQAPMQAVGPSMLSPSVIPQDAAQRIIAAMSSGKKPAARPKPSQLARMDVAECGANGLRYNVGLLSIICIDGVLSMGEDPFAWIFGGCSMLELAQSIRDAADDATTKATVFDVNSPGGSCAGNADVQAAIRYHKTKKPIHAIAHDMACSGAYYTIALADEIVILSSSMIGSIGVFYGTFYDVTAALADGGIVAWNGATGTLKGAGRPGVAVTDEMRKETQRIADATGVDMFKTVAEGRKMTVDQVKAMQAGCFAGADGVSAKLADRVVTSFYDYVEELQAMYAQAPTSAPGTVAIPRPPKPDAQEGTPMPIDWSKATEEDLKNMPLELKSKAGIAAAAPAAEPEKPATPAQLKAAFPDDADFRGKALDNGWTLGQARDEQLKALKASNAALAAKNTELEAKVAGKQATQTKIESQLGGKPTGVPAVSGSTGGESGSEAYEAAIVAKMVATPGMSRGLATGLVNQERPDLRKAYLDNLRAAAPAKR